MSHFVMTARLKPDHEAEVLKILEQGPPFDLEATSLERHTVFIAGEELVFLFEGPRADEEVARLLEQDEALERMRLLSPHIEGSPAFPREYFWWERPRVTEGLSFAPDPGPGDSEGGERG